MDTPLNLSSSQKGKVTETLVAATLILASGGRLSPFVPISDDHGIDLIVLDKQTHRSISVQVKSAIPNAARGTVAFDVRKATHSEAPGRYLIAVAFDPATVALTASWLMPLSEIALLSTEKPDKYALTPNPSPTSNDRYARFRQADAKALADAVLAAINDDR